MHVIPLSAYSLPMTSGNTDSGNGARRVAGAGACSTVPPQFAYTQPPECLHSAPIQSPRTCEPHHGSFGAAVREHARVTVLTRNRGHIEDPPVALPPHDREDLQRRVRRMVQPLCITWCIDTRCIPIEHTSRHMRKMPRRLTRSTRSKSSGSTSSVVTFVLPVMPTRAHEEA